MRLRIRRSILALTWTSIALGFSRPFVLLATVWVEFEPMLGQLVFWGLSGRRVNLREGASIFGRIGPGRPP